MRGDHAGYDILSFEETGAERLIEVKTTKYGSDTPFFVTRNEVVTSERCGSAYQVYRLFAFRHAPRLYTLPGAIRCELQAVCRDVPRPAHVMCRRRAMRFRASQKRRFLIKTT